MSARTVSDKRFPEFTENLARGEFDKSCQNRKPPHADFAVEGCVDPTEPLRDEGPSDVLDHATSEIAISSKVGIEAMEKLAREGFKRPWPPLIKMSDDMHQKIDALFGR